MNEHRRAKATDATATSSAVLMTQSYVEDFHAWRSRKKNTQVAPATKLRFAPQLVHDGVSSMHIHANSEIELNSPDRGIATTRQTNGEHFINGQGIVKRRTSLDWQTETVAHAVPPVTALWCNLN